MTHVETTPEATTRNFTPLYENAKACFVFGLGPFGAFGRHALQVSVQGCGGRIEVRIADIPVRLKEIIMVWLCPCAELNLVWDTTDLGSILRFLVLSLRPLCFHPERFPICL